MKSPNYWNFHEIAGDFDTHVREQLPFYDFAQKLFTIYTQSFLYEKARILELGCSTGNLAANLKEYILDKNIEYLGVDNSKEILELNKVGLPTKFADITNMEIQADIIVSFLTLLFISKVERAKLLDKIYDSLPKGGVLILLERFETAQELSLINHRSILLMKNEKPENIIAKEKSLIGSQYLLNENELPGSPELFFCVSDFKAYLIRK